MPFEMLINWIVHEQKFLLILHEFVELEMRNEYPDKREIFSNQWVFEVEYADERSFVSSSDGDLIMRRIQQNVINELLPK